MFRLFETIRISDGQAMHMDWHERRMNRSRREIWAAEDPVSPGAEIVVPGEFSTGLVRCNVLYGQQIQEIKFSNYEKRPVRSLKLISGDMVDYHLKYADRALLDALFGERGDCDEVIIVKNGLITDTSMSNLIFFDGTNWITPAKPLLNGTCRDRLVSEGRLIEQDIRPTGLGKFTGCKLINAMRYPEEEAMIPVSEIC
ncbi:MAG: aminotransferase class IV family protein [bacterium]